ncbi:MAG: Ppx/GppA phosphatase family protein [Ketobacter sp.]|uniref:Ppx/GppA phosphatase family protein n=1 Tax=Ketobacter sp. MCCC 1A13808 TaxID=2602738 RepID=UPI001E498BA1|nr:Ppx/GppA phosphatase family protein [Ketobacter sp. MCCC 1A13808]
MTEQPDSDVADAPKMAAIDMGSNSFHMVIARTDTEEVRPTQKLAEKVMLAAGLGEDNVLDDDAFQRGLDCLRRFAQCLEGIEPKWIRCVGTNTLRKARNGEAFLREARQILQCPVEVVAGREEARLIYLGVSHSLASSIENRLVFDIGGGSTEFIIGREFEPLLTESLHLGCVSYRERYFPDGKITEQGFKKAVLKTRVEVSSIEKEYRDLGWSSAVGASGTVKAIKTALIENAWYTDGIELDGLYKLRDKILSFNTLADIDIPGIKAERRVVLPSGLAILIGIFEQLKVEKLRFSEGAMREGILYDMLGRHEPEDVRVRTIRSLMKRCGVDEAHAERVQKTALELFRQVQVDWDFGEYCRDWLNWSALSHEIGLMVSHSGFHKHGAYLLTYSDLPGFTNQDQAIIAALVGGHRRKFRDTAFEPILPHLQEKVRRLMLVLRLAVVFNRSRRDVVMPDYRVKTNKDGVTINFDSDWIQSQPLLLAELQQEQDAWSKVGHTLEFE